ncbi:hypothetical protein AC1031_019584 [Aphanomyces cochlioides]|nr:hypothetical protein AC1031_019584 [Aphanomyces cochlioides]
MKVLRNAISGSRNRYTQDGYDLDLTYIHDRVVAMGYPATGVEKTYRNDVSDVSSFLNKKHRGKYFVYNLSERHYDGNKFGGRVDECGFPDHHPPPLQILLDILNRMLEWYMQDPENVVVVHCMAGKGRTGVVITCFLIVLGYFEENYNLNYYDQSDESLLEYVQTVNGIFWKKRGQGVRYPSQSRYIYYFIKYLCRLSLTPRQMQYRLPPLPRPCRLFLRSIVMTGIPNIDAGGCSPFLLVHPAPSEHVPSKILYNSAWDTPTIQSYMADSQRRVVFPTECIVEGDFLVRIYNSNATLILGKKESQLCHFTLHTDYVRPHIAKNSAYLLPKSEVDDASDNKRFPERFTIECMLEEVPPSREDESVRHLMPHDVREKEQFIKRGWLYKQGGFVQNWKRRWCVAKEGKLTYYKSETKLQATGVVSLEGATIDRCQGRDMAKLPKASFYFKVEPPSGAQKKRIYYFGAESEADMLDWVRVLKTQNGNVPPLLQYRNSRGSITKSASFVEENNSFVSTTSSFTARGNNQFSFRNSLPSSASHRMMHRHSFEDRSAQPQIVEAKKPPPRTPIVSTYEYSTEELLSAADLQQHLKETGQFTAFRDMDRADAVQLVLLLAHDMFPGLLDAVDEDSGHLIDMVAGRESFK